MNDKLQTIKEMADKKLTETLDMQSLDEFRLKLLGKKGELTKMLKSLGKLSPEERPKAGQMLNEARIYVEERLEKAKKQLTLKEMEMKLGLEAIDVTMPGKTVSMGNVHPMMQVIDEIKRMFIGMGYEIAEGPDVETDYYNFAALNIPANHPAKDEQDTFYVEGGFVLRTHTSPVQIRVIEKNKPPIRIIAPGRVYRSDEVDATHSPVFHQCEALVIDKNITMGDLKGSLELFAKELFGPETKVRFRPHHFPFTEPSAEMDYSCFACQGAGCRVCKGSGWVELLGCGMVHPKVLEMSGIDPSVYSGFAFGMGLERVAMRRFGISDSRLMYENDVKFLKQFN